MKLEGNTYRKCRNLDELTWSRNLCKGARAHQDEDASSSGFRGCAQIGVKGGGNQVSTLSSQHSSFSSDGHPVDSNPSAGSCSHPTESPLHRSASLCSSLSIAPEIPNRGIRIRHHTLPLLAPLSLISVSPLPRMLLLLVSVLQRCCFALKVLGRLPVALR